MARGKAVYSLTLLNFTQTEFNYLRHLLHTRFAKFFFFGNYFYGICAIALAIEASLQLSHVLPEPLFFILLFSSTILYYNTAYLLTEPNANPPSPRSLWYAANIKLLKNTQLLLLAFLFVGSLLFFFLYSNAITNLKLLDWTLLLIFPLSSVFYYGISVAGKHIRLRQIGWLKPVLIAFVWSGLVTIYPLLYTKIASDAPVTYSLVLLYLFIKNFMFILVLSILFDIKDYAMDYNEALKTVVVKLGLRSTLFYLIIPLCLVGLFFFLLIAQARGFSTSKIILNSIPFLSIVLAAWQLRNRQSIFFYLVVIDGLMLLKALCGIGATIFF